MRIIAGTAKGRTLKSFTGDAIRPTSDRAREAIFSVLFSRLGNWQDKTVLDLCTGTGAMAIEALSRGAASAVLVDQTATAETLVRQNLASCQLEERAQFIRGSLPRALDQLSPGQTFDVVFLDPPYRQGLADQILASLAAAGCLHGKSLVCVETGLNEALQASYGKLALDQDRKYGSTRMSIFSPTESSQSS
jgi:16S rRNA (guanine966-N2)-methyltransferase